VVSKITELPGQNLFQYVGDDGETSGITSSDVNDYIREATGGDFTAKNFRTWGASVIAFEQMLSAQEEDVRKISLKTVLEPVAEALGNTPAISRKSYVHPKLIEAARNDPKRPLGAIERPRARKYLASEEVGLLEWLMKGSRKQTNRKQSGKAAEAAVKAAEVSMEQVDEVAEKVAETA
jgi:DNA topoisomerase-1